MSKRSADDEETNGEKRRRQEDAVPAEKPTDASDAAEDTSNESIDAAKDSSTDAAKDTAKENEAKPAEIGLNAKQISDRVVDLDEARSRLHRALAILGCYGSIDGAHHKQWTITEAMKILAGPDWSAHQIDLREYDAEKGEYEYEEWDEGIAP